MTDGWRGTQSPCQHSQDPWPLTCVQTHPHGGHKTWRGEGGRSGTRRLDTWAAGYLGLKLWAPASTLCTRKATLT